MYRNALRVLARKKRDRLEVSDVIFDGLYESVQSVARVNRKLNGVDVSVEFDGRSVGWLQESSSLNWSERIQMFVEMVESIGGDESLLRDMLRADGWSWNSRTLLTPPWFRPHSEVLAVDAAEISPMLDWLRTDEGVVLDV